MYILSVSKSRRDWLACGQFNWSTGEFQGQEQHIRMQGTYLQVKNDLGPRTKRQGGGKRAAITRFSPASRRGMLKRLHTIAWDNVPTAMHLVLTFPDFPSIEDAKRCYNSFWKRLLRENGEHLWCFWKLEPQQRGAPHFHLLIGGLPVREKNSLMAWQRKIRLWWKDIIRGVYYTGTKVAFPFVDYVRQGASMQRYIAKYVSKDAGGCDSLEPVSNLAGASKKVTSWAKPGRFWGVYGRKNVPWASLFEVATLRDGWYVEFRRLVRRYLKSKGYRVPWSLFDKPDRGLSLLVENMADWDRVLGWLLVKHKSEADLERMFEDAGGPD